MSIEKLKNLINEIQIECKNNSDAICEFIKKDSKALNESLFQNHITIDLSLDEDPDLSTLTSKKGIYVFMTKDEIELTDKMNEEFPLYDEKKDKDIYAAFAKINDGNIKKHSAGVCFYLGKHENLETRIREHIIHSSITTSSLKLYCDFRKELKPHLVIHCFELCSQMEKYSRILLTEVERELHNSLKPLVGSAR